MKPMTSFVLLALLLNMGATPTPAEPVPTPIFDVSLRHEVERSIATGLEFLAQAQKENGSWSYYVGVTGLAVTAFLQAPRGMQERYRPNIDAGLAFLLANVRDNGGIYPDIEPELRAYNTSICLMALVATGNPAHRDVIVNARDYLLSLQADEDEGMSPDSASYGGIGYNRDERSDISNMQFALEALRESEGFKPTAEFAGTVEYRGDAVQETAEISNKELFWEKAILFLQRSQNYTKYNDYQWSGDDGGFVYYPGVSKAGGTTSYGGMTYAGMKSFIHAGLDKSDERVRKAYAWIRANYTVDTNPEMGEQGLFYYYNVMAKALAIYGDSLLVDSANLVHDWRGDLANKLISIQKADGSWVNENGRWWENNPDLVTAYCLLALEKIVEFESKE